VSKIVITIEDVENGDELGYSVNYEFVTRDLPQEKDELTIAEMIFVFTNKRIEEIKNSYVEFSKLEGEDVKVVEEITKVHKNGKSTTERKEKHSRN